ncbi:MAG: hypothetical protein L3J38_01355, partial [Thiomicrorhabdus sp.]|nr:hypothetical protein [Thiomicrorhabdus sp.]
KDFSSALKYFREAEGEVGVFSRYLSGNGSKDMINNIRVMSAVCLFQLNKGDEAAELFNDIMDDYEDDAEMKKIFKVIYQGA